ncbi:hypothetical protein [Pedobacter panaciterrae]
MKKQLLHERIEILDLAFSFVDQLTPERPDDYKSISVRLTTGAQEVYYRVIFDPIYDGAMNFVVWRPRQDIEMSIKDIIN